MITTTQISEHCGQADKARVLELLADVAGWTVNYHDPATLQRRDEAARLIAAIGRSDDFVKDARRFLGGCAEDARAQRWLQ
jgi:hypothetical protein